MFASRILSSNTLWARAGYVLLAVFAAAFLARAAWPNPDYFPVDFKYFWLSGKIWAEGISPYGPELEALGKAAFPGVRINPFFYPPSWRLISSVTALASPLAAEAVWAWLSALAVGLTAWLIADRLSAQWPALNRWRWFALCFATLALCNNAVEIGVIIGQPTPFLALAAAALLWSVPKRNALVAAAALTVLFLKPQLSIGVGAAALFIPFLHRPLAAAVAITLALAGFGLAVDQPIEAARGFLHNLSLYKAFPENLPLNMSGLNFITSSLFSGWVASPFILAGVTGAACFGACLFLKNNRADFNEPQTAVAALACAILTAAFVMPTHNSDLLVTIPAFIAAPYLAPRMRVYFLAGAILVMRSMSMSVLLAEFWRVEKTVIVSLLDTGGAFVMLAVVAHTLWRRNRPILSANERQSLDRGAHRGGECAPAPRPGMLQQPR